MAYTPELNTAACCTLRRIAWAAELPMTKTLNQLVIQLPEIFDKKIICSACKDQSKCNICGFSELFNPEENSATIKKEEIRRKNPVKEFRLKNLTAARPQEEGIRDEDFIENNLNY